MAQLLQAGGIIFLLVAHQSSAITNAASGHKEVFSKRNGSFNAPFADQSRDLCSTRLETALSKMRSNRRSGNDGNEPLDLNGYALHQALRSAPYDMYLTDMRVRAPAKWANVDQCRYDPTTGTLQVRLALRDLSVTGKVKLYNEKLIFLVPPVERCSMTLRMRNAGVGFTVQPTGDRAVNSVRSRTAATFVEPKFVSVHSYGCKNSSQDAASRSSEGVDPKKRSSKDDSKAFDAAGEVSQEMEEVFVRGVRSLITRYMEHHMEPALRDSLMMNLDTYIVEEPTTEPSTTESAPPPPTMPAVVQQPSNITTVETAEPKFYRSVKNPTRILFKDTA